MRELWAFLPYVWRTARRARLRSALTLLGAALAMALFAFVRTVDCGVAELARRSEQPLLVVFQESRFCPLTSELPVRYAETIDELPGVAEVLPTLVFINSCRANLDVVTLHGVPADRLEGIHDLEVLEGSAADFRGRADGALVGDRLAARRGATVGARLRLGALDVHVCGIVRGASPGVRNLAFVHLEQLSLARDRQGAATQFFVRLTQDAPAVEVAAAIDAAFATDTARTDTKTMQAFVQGAVNEIAEVVDFARLLGYLGVIVVALVLANTVFISAQARSGEMGLLETVGLTKPKLAALIAGEGIGLGLVGGALGTAAVLGVLFAFPVTFGVEGYGIDLEPSWTVALQGLAASLLVGIVASLGPAIATVRRPLHLALKDE